VVTDYGLLASIVAPDTHDKRAYPPALVAKVDRLGREVEHLAEAQHG
jgi:hypothetical protein